MAKVAPDYSVPHCTFHRTRDGFTASFRRLPLLAFKSPVLSPSVFAYVVLGCGFLALLIEGIDGLVTFAYIVAGLIATAIFFQQTFGGSLIQVTKDAVIINGRSISRAHFSHFFIATTLQIQGKPTRAVLGYSYGNRRISFGGAWREDEATEFSAALNQELRAAPIASDGTRVSPEELRTARPTDF